MNLPLTTKVDELFSEWNKPDSPGFALAVIKDNEIIYKCGYGTADLEHNVPISSSSVFDIGSISKQFTAMCIAFLVRQGKLSLEDEVQKYISELPYYGYPITLRHLINHTSGIRDYLILMELSGMRLENYYSEDEIIGLIARQKELNFKPGEEFLYSNSGYLLLALIIKRVSGKPLRSFADENIFTPLGMKSSHFHDDFTMIVNNRAIGYSPKREGGFRIDMSFFDVVGDGFLYTTVEDLYLWDKNFYQNILGDYGQDLIEELVTPGRLNSGEPLAYAFGLFIGEYRGLKIVSHSGASSGYRAEMIRFPEQKFSVICLSNLGSAYPMRLTKQIADLYLAREFTEQKKDYARSEGQFEELLPSNLESIVGIYLCSKTGIMLEILFEEGKLLIDYFGTSIPIVPIGPNLFTAMEGPLDINIEFEGSDSNGPSQRSFRMGDGVTNVYQQLSLDVLNIEQLKDFAGEYHCDELDATYNIIVEADKLLLTRKNSPQEMLKPTTKDLFKGVQTTYQFIRNDHNQVTGFKLGASRVKNILFTK